uniref:Palmitoyl-protein hydrolase n=1 Tax=Rhabditophanes sp. KR3021 TaxID=114890 RepID=A0AC35TTK5_9BILA
MQQAVCSVPPLVIPALVQGANKTLIFCHGRGDTAYGWFDTFNKSSRLPNVKYILPTAANRPYSFHGGEPCTAWYDVHNNKGKRLEDNDTIESARQYLYSLIAEEQKLGTKPENILLGGFSQGGCLSLYATLSAPLKIGGCVAMSAYLPQKHLFPQICIENKETPIWLATGDRDDIITLETVKESVDVINKVNSELNFTIIRGLGHTVTNQVCLNIIYLVNFGVLGNG